MNGVQPNSTLGMSMSDCFDTGLYSDLRIKDSNGHEYAVHRIIVCGQSDVLAKACKPENGFKEAHTGVIDLENDDPGAIKAMLEFMYRGAYTIRDTDNAMLETAHAYVMGEIYCVQDLKDLAAYEFSKLSRTDYETADFVAAVRVIYESIPNTSKDRMRDIIIRVIANHYDELIMKNDFEAVLDDFGALGKDVLRFLAEGRAKPPKCEYFCPGNSKRAFNNMHKANLAIDHREKNAIVTCPTCGQAYTPQEWAGHWRD